MSSQELAYQIFLLHIVFCYGFVKDKNSKLILMCRSKLVSYYPYKGFVMLDQGSQSLKNVPPRFKQLIHDINMFYSDAIISNSKPIPCVLNNLKHIYPSGTILDKITSTSYDDRNYYFGMFFKNIHLVLVTKFITHLLLNNGKITWPIQIMKISSTRVFTYLLKI